MSYTKREIFGNAALSSDQVRAVRLRRGESPRVVAADYGVAPETIRKIWRGDTYTMVSDEAPAYVPGSMTAEALAGSLARTLALAGVSQVPASLDEALRAQALKEDGPSAGLEKLQAVAASSPEALLKDLTDGGTKP